MSKQVSPFAALTGAEKQIRWLEYQSIRLPYVDCAAQNTAEITPEPKTVQAQPTAPNTAQPVDRPQPPPEVPRVLPADFQKTRHSQYDAVIARMKQAELQSRRYQALQSSQKPQ